MAESVDSNAVSGRLAVRVGSKSSYILLNLSNKVKVFEDLYILHQATIGGCSNATDEEYCLKAKV